MYSPVLKPDIFDPQAQNSSVLSSVDSARASHLVADHSVVDSKPLTDGFSRRLTYLRLSITNFCNFRCEYCLPNGYQGKRPSDELSVAESKL